MVINPEIWANQLSNWFGTLHYRVCSDNKLGRTDLNKMCESMFIPILNRIYGWNLVNKNAVVANEPAIDLEDCQSNVVVQVTSDRSKNKVQHTIPEGIGFYPSKEIGALESLWGIAGRWQEEDMKEFLAIRGGDLLEYETELVTTKWLFWDTELKHGDKKGTLCKCADEGAVRSCIRAFAKDHADDMYRMPFQTCRDRAKEALGDCCLKVGRKMDTTTRGVLKVEFYK